MPKTQQGYFDLGSFGRQVTTENFDAQLWFDRGLTWAYGFNHEEAVQCFEKALGHDPSCAMAYWGLSFSLGPHYNKPWEQFDENELKATLGQARDGAEKARAASERATPVEKALAHAIKFRYPSDVDDKDYKGCNVHYAEAMAEVYGQFGHDIDVAVLYADALMNLSPWELWDLRTGKPTEKGRASEAKQVLEKAFRHSQAYEHPGLLHTYIHCMEMSATPEVTIRAADRLRTLVPDSGHLVHMPTHIDFLIGDWRKAVASNRDAYIADDKLVAQSGGGGFYTFYRVHNQHSLIYAALFAGQFQIAIDTVEAIENNVPESCLRDKDAPMADWLESAWAIRIHILIRFGKWEDIKAYPLPEDQKLFCATTATIHYAKGLAFAVTGDISAAEQSRVDFQAAFDTVPSSRLEYPNKCRDVLQIASAMLDGELEYRKGNFGVAFDHLREAIKRDDGLIYCEPWAWMQPTRHAYAALLLEQGHVKEACEVYAADLGYNNDAPKGRQHPNNVWALHGYHECLMRLERIAEVSIVRPLLKIAVAGADVKIHSSCFCRRETAQSDRDAAVSACCEDRAV